MTAAWVDASAGVAGNMLLGALLDAGADRAVVERAVAAVHPALQIRVERTTRHQLNAALVIVVDSRTGRAADAAPEQDHGHDHDHDDHHDRHHHHHEPHRPWREVRALLDAAELATGVRARAHGVFARLAAAEAAVHGQDPDDVEFHEVGSLDAIGDVVGCAAALADLGVDGFVCSPVALGGGEQTRGAHGRIPIPGPAVLQLVARHDVAVSGGTAPHEMTTPTGAALVAEFATGYGPLPPMVVAAVGAGAGQRDPHEVANLTRVVLGRPADRPATAAQVVIETNVDDLDPRLWPGVLAALLDAGARDAWLTPIVMKKGRPAHTLAVLLDAARRETVLDVVFEHTTAIGAREYPVTKHALERRVETVEVAGRPVRVKVAERRGRVVNAQPEFDDVLAVASATGRPAAEILAEAQRAVAERIRPV